MSVCPYELITRISRLIDQAEINKNPADFIEARRLLNNDLPDAIGDRVVTAVEKAVAKYKEMDYSRRKHVSHTLVAVDRRPE